MVRFGSSICSSLRTMWQLRPRFGCHRCKVRQFLFQECAAPGLVGPEEKGVTNAHPQQRPGFSLKTNNPDEDRACMLGHPEGSRQSQLPENCHVRELT